MKKLAAIILAVMLCGCNAGWYSVEVVRGVERGDDGSSPTQSLPQTLSEAPAPPEKEQPDAPEVTLEFAEPTREYNIVAELPTEDGFAIVYEQHMDDEFNKRFGSDTIFWGLYAQLFDAEGKLIETIDFDRHNSYSIPTPVARLEDRGDYIYFESRHSLDNGLDINGQPLDSYEMDYCFYLAVNDEGLKEIAPYQAGDRYRLKSYYVLAEKDGVSLQQGSEYDEQKGRDLTVFRLVGEQYGESRITLETVDASISGGLSDIIYGADIYGNPAEHDPLYSLSIELDPNTSQAVIKNSKVTLSLDFAKCVAKESRQYTAEMLTELVAASPDGKTELWAADSREFFEAPNGCDYVVKNETGGLIYLYSGSEKDQIRFIDNERIWVNRISEMKIYDALTGELHKNQPGFDLGGAFGAEGADDGGRFAVGIEVDRENRLLLIAHLSSGDPWGQQPVTLTLLDWDGIPQSDLDTGLEMMFYRNISFNTVSITVDGGSAAISVANNTDIPSVVVDYAAE